MTLFEKYLTEELGISKSRTSFINEGISKLHGSLCFLDSKNLSKIKNIGLKKLLEKYAEIEDVKQIFETKYRIRDMQFETRYFADGSLMDSLEECAEELRAFHSADQDDNMLAKMNLYELCDNYDWRIEYENGKEVPLGMTETYDCKRFTNKVKK